MSRIPSKKNKLTIFEKIKFKKNEFFRFYITRILKHLSNYLKKTTTINGFENPDNFEDFGPIVLSDEEDRHSKKIKYAIDNPNILNLALTGPLGSGKSTILKTFKNNYIEYNYLDISLATFDKKTLDTEKIEHNILKQLFYSVEHKQIPESRFKRIENLKGIKLKTFLFILWLCSLSYFLKFEFFNELIKTLHLNYQFAFLSFIYGLYFIAYSSVLVYKLMTFILNFKLTKFKIKDVDFDNDQDKKTINFENEIDEILYFFERNPIEIVFFQDLDRFNESEIFIKLREINNLINNYEPIKKKRKVTFIYAVSDDIFKENERAKFFDFIIPVIPVINYTSSSSKLLAKLNPDIRNKKLSKDFIDDVSLFLNDYRTIKSIYNEYQIYKNIIGKQLDSYNNLLAMMIYKNIEPTDFDKLNSNNGYVYNVIQNSKELIEKRIQFFDDKIIELSKKTEDAKNETLKNAEELRRLYVSKFCELVITKHNYPFHAFNINNNRQSLETTISDDVFDLFRKETDIKFYTGQYSSLSHSGISFKQIEEAIDKANYSERLEIILNNQKDKLNKIKVELNNFKKEKQDLKSKKLYEILDDSNSIAFFKKYSDENKGLNNLKLINYLLIEGYINEDYNHYISYFHPGSITKEDNDFLMSLLPSEKPLPPNHKLKEVNSLIKRIKPENYNREAILNFTLIDYLIENKITSKFNSIINLISKENEKSISFIDDYLEYANENNKSIFFKTILNNWSEFWNSIITKSNFIPEKIELYLTYIFKYLDLTTINNIDKQHKLSNYISELDNLRCFENDVNVETLQKFLKDSPTEFKNLNYEEKHRSLFEFIYNNNIYEINEKMIELFISHFNQNNININNLKTSNYTTIKESGMSKLIEYIDKDLDIYLEDVFIKLENNTNESQESITSILNNARPETSIEIIEKTKFSVTDLSKIETIKMQSKLITSNKITTDWKNLITYYKKSKEIDDTIIEYLNIEHNYNILSKIRIDDSDASIKTSFSKDLIMSDISDESYSRLTKSLPFYYKNGNEFIGINNSKMKLLIDSKTISLSSHNFTMIDDQFNDLLIFLIEKNVVNFMESIEKYTLDSSIILKILKSQAFITTQKLSVIENTTDDVLMNNKNLLIELSKFLLENKISKISSALLIALISNSTTHKDKVELTNNYFNFIENFNLSVVIEKIEEFSKLLIGKHPKVDNIKHNQQLIKNLEGKLISNKKVSKDSKKIELFPYLKSRI